MSPAMDCRPSAAHSPGLASAIQGGIGAARFASEVQKRQPAPSDAPIKAREDEVERPKAKSRGSRRKLRKLIRKLLRRFGLLRR
jgi:hypothetical protein